MLIGYIKGYDFCDVTKKRLEKEEFLSELINENPNIKEEISRVLDNNGYIIGIESKKVLKLVYIFELDGKVLTFKNKVLSKEIDPKTQDKFEEIITSELKEKLVLEGLEKVNWKDIEIVPEDKSGFSYLVFFICVIFGIIFDNIGMGFLWGLILGTTTKVAIVKRKEKKEK